MYDDTPVKEIPDTELQRQSDRHCWISVRALQEDRIEDARHHARRAININEEIMRRARILWDQHKAS